MKILAEYYKGDKLIYYLNTKNTNLKKNQKSLKSLLPTLKKLS